MLSSWFESLGTLGQIFLCMAVPASLILLIQIIMSFVGLGDDAGDGVFGDVDDGFDTLEDMSADSAADLAELQFFSLRSIVAFFVTFGWMGVSLVQTTLHIAWVISIAFVCGLAVMTLVAFLMRALYRLQTNGNTDLRRAIGVSGTVYMTIPANRSGKGKINILLQESYLELEAVTDDETPLYFGTEVTVLGLAGGNTLIVTKK